MASNYPTSLDNFTNPTSNDSLNSPSHSLQHANINDAVEAIEAKLGIGASPAGSATSGHVLTAGTGGTTTWSAPSIAGLTQVAPTSVTKGASGTASASSAGVVTFSGTESISLNGVFSASYVNYKILFNYTGSSQVDTYLRLRVSGSDNSTANSYQSQYLYARDTSVSAARNTNNLFVFNAGGNAEVNINDMTMFRPFLTEKTGFKSQGSYTGLNNAVLDIYLTVGNHSQTVSYDGFTLFPASGTISGNIRVYGYKES